MGWPAGVQHKPQGGPLPLGNRNLVLMGPAFRPVFAGEHAPSLDGLLRSVAWQPTAYLLLCKACRRHARVYRRAQVLCYVLIASDAGHLLGRMDAFGPLPEYIPCPCEPQSVRHVKAAECRQ